MPKVIECEQCGEAITEESPEIWVHVGTEAMDQWDMDADHVARPPLEETACEREARLNRRARRAARTTNAELERVTKLFAEGKADIHDVRAARHDAQYWNQIVNNLNGYV